MAAWLALIPWPEVIKAAPAIAKKASELLGGFNNRKSGGTASGPSGSPESAKQISTTALELKVVKLETRIGDIKREVDSLDEKMMESSQLIKELADQNAQLITRVDQNRKQIFWLGVAVVVAGVGVLATLVLALF